MGQDYSQLAREEWVSFPGGELEGRRPKVLCAACRDALKRESEGRRSGERALADGRRKALCFQCYRADLDRQHAIAAAGQLNTTTDARFQYQLPLKPVDRMRLEGLKAARTEARTASVHGIGVYVDKRRRAQIAARHALQAIAEGLRARSALASERHQAMVDAIHAAELQLPDAWLPFVVSR